MHDKYEVSLKLILKNEAGDFLGLNAAIGNLMGSYEFAGGRINVDEYNKPFEESLRREVIEELGDIQYELNLRPVALGRHTRENGTHVLYVFFEAVYQDGEIKLSDEHSKYEWLNLAVADLNTLFKSGNLEGIKMYLGR